MFRTADIITFITLLRHRQMFGQTAGACEYFVTVFAFIVIVLIVELPRMPVQSFLVPRYVVAFVAFQRIVRTVDQFVLLEVSLWGAAVGAVFACERFNSFVYPDVFLEYDTVVCAVVAHVALIWVLAPVLLAYVPCQLFVVLRRVTIAFRTFNTILFRFLIGLQLVFVDGFAVTIVLYESHTKHIYI